MTEDGFQLVRGIGFAAALIAVAALQRLRPHATSASGWRLNLPLWGGNLLILGAVCGACTCTAARWAYGSGVGLFNVAPAPGWIVIPGTVLLLDLVSYGWHRANHQVALLWRFHRVHHSDVSFTVATALRFHPGELLISLPIRLAAVIALGAPPLAVVIFEVVFTVANLFEHGNVALPLRLERALARVWVTPALHRRHHSVQPSDAQSNFGTIFTLWDRALGTFRDNSSVARVTIGAPGVTAPATLLQAWLQPFAARVRG